MPQSTYERVRLAAERRTRDDSLSTWTLADAVLTEVPRQAAGQRNDLPLSRGEGHVERQLAQLADLLTADGVTTPSGDPYTVDALANLRETAMAWSADQRHDEAAYRTHQEAGSPSTPGGKLLAALCAVARGERPRRPSDADAQAWNTAIDRVQAKIARPRAPRFPVAANDLRVAMRRSPNVPGPSRNPHGAPAATPTQVATALADPEQRQAAFDALIESEGHGAATTVAIHAGRASQHIDDPVDAESRAGARAEGTEELAAIGRAKARVTLEGLLHSIMGEARAAIRLAQAGDPGVFGDLDEQIDFIITMLSGLKSIVTGEGAVTDEALADLLDGGE